jgi:hypothetical protein
MKTTVKTISLKMIIVFSVAAMMWVAGSLAQATVVVVTPSSMDGWAFLTTDENGAQLASSYTGADFVAGPATPPLGTGSVNLFAHAPHGDYSAQVRNSNYGGVKLADLTALSYSSYANAWNGQQVPYIELNVSQNNDGNYDDILFFEPAYQTPASGNPSLPNQGDPILGTWQTWDALDGGWWSNSGDGGLNPGMNVKPLSAYLAVHPNAAIIDSSPTLARISHHHYRKRLPFVA